MPSESVKVNNLIIKFGEFYAVNDITFNVSGGEIFGLLGANGAGKTTTIRALCGLLIPTSGTVNVNGYDLKDDSYKVKQSVGYMSQKFTLYEDLTVEENLEFAAGIHKLDGIKSRERSGELLDLIGFNKSVKELVKNLPGGIKQELALAAAMIHNPDIIFLDEPTAGVAPASRLRFWNLIKQLADKGKTLFVTTHYMDEAENCTRIALMRNGKIIAADSPNKLKKQAFPGIIAEVDFNGFECEKIISEISQMSGFSGVEVYGLRHHICFDNEENMKKAASLLPSPAYYKIITPSLEDVFIHFVGGDKK